MMHKNLNELSLEELMKQRKTLKLVSGIFIGVLIVLCLALLYKYLETKEFSALMIMPITLLPIAILNYANIKKIIKEINSRK